MSIETAYTGLRWRLARLVATNASRLSLTEKDWREADEMIDAMPHSKLLSMLAAEDEPSQQ